MGSGWLGEKCAFGPRRNPFNRLFLSDDKQDCKPDELSKTDKMLSISAMKPFRAPVEGIRRGDEASTLLMRDGRRLHSGPDRD